MHSAAGLLLRRACLPGACAGGRLPCRAWLLPGGARTHALARAQRAAGTRAAADGGAAAAPAEQQQKAGGGGKGGKPAQPRKQQQQQSTSSDEDIRKLRIEKAEQLRAAGREPYAYRFQRTHLAAQLHAQWGGRLKAGQVAEPGELGEGGEVAVAGRVLARRVMGKLAFLKLADDSGDIQLYVEKTELEAQQPGGFADLKGLVDVGDIVGVRGGLKKTDKGELSVMARSLEVLTKSLLPLPDKWHGLQDIEKRYRQRYVDMIVTEGVRDTFRARARVLSACRRLLEAKGFLEVETPVLEASAGGADARPFVTYHNALERPFTLRIATELHLKRLVVGGLERVFEIGRIFRNEGTSARHNPEFTSVELYQAYADYHDMMDLTEEIIRECTRATQQGLQVQYQGVMLDFERPFARKSMHELVREHTGLDFEAFGGDLEAARAAAQQALAGRQLSDASRAALRSAASMGHLLNEVFEAAVEGELVQPTFVLDHPVEISPLAKPHRARPGLVERFELFVAGRELANSFSELTDPLEQRRRLEAQVTAHRAANSKAAAEREALAALHAQQPELTSSSPGDLADSGAASNGAAGGERHAGGAAASSSGSDAQAAAAAAGGVHKQHAAAGKSDEYDVVLDEDFLTALEYGMPPTGGMGMGMDRLVMLLTDSASIRDVIAFPLMKY